MKETNLKTPGTAPQVRAAVQGGGSRIVLGALSVILLLSVSAGQRAQAQTYSVLHSFTGAPGDGVTRDAGLVSDSSGNLYGTTASGGAYNSGSVFELVKASSYTETLLYSFGRVSGDGVNPTAALVMDSSGNLYGTTYSGGAYSGGTVFELVKSTGYAETLLHSFQGSPNDGAAPSAGLILDSAGNLYGTTSSGGSLNSGEVGAVFELVKSAGYAVTLLYSFNGFPDGAYPLGGLVMDGSGNLFGMTVEGGTNNLGTVFELAKGATSVTLLYSFAGGSDGAYPQPSLIMDGSGNLFGTTLNSGANNQGTVVELAKGATKATILHSFVGPGSGGTGADGAEPFAGLVSDGSGNLYGSTYIGGTYGNGIVFELVKSSGYAESVLHNFGSVANDGAQPYSSLLMDAAGNLFGTTQGGGTSFDGAVFELTTVTTPQAAIQALIGQVNALKSAGVLNGGQDNSLVTQLQDALAGVNAWKVNKAIGNLQSFISEVIDLQGSRVLTSTQASALLNAGNSLMQQLQQMM